MSSLQNLSNEDSANYRAMERREMLPFLPDPCRRSLEIGCGEGAFSAELKRRGTETWGIELSDSAANVARSRLDRVLVGDALERLAETPDASFDAVVCNDVLEHLVDPYTLLDRVKTKLSPDGMVVASIPNIRHFSAIRSYLFEKDWRYEEWGLFDKTHLRFFTRKSILRMFDELGYEVRKIEGISASRPLKFRVANLMTLGALEDAAFLQFAVVATPRR